MTVAEQVCAKLREDACTSGAGGGPCDGCINDPESARDLALADYIEAADALAAAQTSEESVDIGAILTRYNAALSRLREVL